MKKLLVLCGLSFLMWNHPVSAKEAPSYDVKGMEKAIDHMIVDQFQDELQDAVADFYKRDSVELQYDWKEQRYDVVELEQSKDGHKLQYPYVVTFNVLVYDSKKNARIGTDTLTFGVVPVTSKETAKKQGKMFSVAKLLNYRHAEPLK